MKRFVTLVVTCGFALSAHAGCYSIYRAGQIIYQSSEAPVDTALQFHASIPQRFGQGATLVYLANADSCVFVDSAPSENLGKTVQASYLLPHAGTAPRGPTIPLSIQRGAEINMDSIPSMTASGGYGGNSSLNTGPRGGQFYYNGNGNKTYVGSGRGGGRH